MAGNIIIASDSTTDLSAELIEKNYSEYTVTVDATTAAKTDGANTQYTPYPTRLISTLNGFKANTAETKLYDEYGGYTGGEKYEATGFFYTKKIGDRWWTIDPLGNPYSAHIGFNVLR